MQDSDPNAPVLGVIARVEGRLVGAGRNGDGLLNTPFALSPPKRS